MASSNSPNEFETLADLNISDVESVLQLMGELDVPPNSTQDGVIQRPQSVEMGSLGQASQPPVVSLPSACTHQQSSVIGQHGTPAGGGDQRSPTQQHSPAQAQQVPNMAQWLPGQAQDVPLQAKQFPVQAQRLPVQAQRLPAQALPPSDIPTRSKSGEKKTEPRSRFTSQQTNTLSKVYVEHPFPSADAKVALAQELDIDVRRIQVWFENKRARERKLLGPTASHHLQGRSVRDGAFGQPSRSLPGLEVPMTQLLAQDTEGGDRGEETLPTAQAPDCSEGGSAEDAAHHSTEDAHMTRAAVEVPSWASSGVKGQTARPTGAATTPSAAVGLTASLQSVTSLQAISAKSTSQQEAIWSARPRRTTATGPPSASSKAESVPVSSSSIGSYETQNESRVRVKNDLKVHGEAWKLGGSAQWRVLSDARVKDVLGDFTLGGE